MRQIALILFSLFFATGSFGQTPRANAGFNDLQGVSQDFRSWRARYAPFTGDEVNRALFPALSFLETQ
jgi:hypothetical protein